MKKIPDKLEIILFYTFVVLNTIPVLFSGFFLSVDGPAHLYNSNLILELLSGNDSFISQYICFNNQITPNITGHFLMTGLLSFLPAVIAEKIILLIYVVGLPLGVRNLVQVINAQSKFISFLVFPFSYSFLLFYGSYNFNIAAVLLLFAFAYNIKFQEVTGVKKTIFLTFFASLIALSHFFVFCVYLLISFIHLVISNIQSNSDFKQYVKSLIKQLLVFSISLIPAIIIIATYLGNSTSFGDESTFLSFSEIWKSILTISPLVNIDFGRAIILSKVFLIILISILVVVFIQWIRQNMTKPLRNIFTDLWFIIPTVLFLLLFIIPDSFGVKSAFFVSRLVFFFFVFLIIALAKFNHYSWSKYLLLAVIIVINSYYIIHNSRNTLKSKEITSEISECAELIEDDKVVFTITESDNFLLAHASNYLGAEKRIIITENYEAFLDDFPLKWNCEKMPQLYLGDIKFISLCDKNVSDKSNKTKQNIDYVFILADTENQEKLLKLQEFIATNLTDFKLIYSGKFDKIRLYKFMK